MKTRVLIPRGLLCLLLLFLASSSFAGEKLSVHRQLLELADRHQTERHAGIAAVKSKAEQEGLQNHSCELYPQDRSW